MSVPQAVAVHRDRDVTVITVDDGKANALSFDVLAQLHAAVDEAYGHEGAIALVGRPGRFSAGFDLSVMRGEPEQVREIVRQGAELAIKLYDAPLPVVIGCTGHALAMGAILLLAADLRVGAAGEFKIGMNEVAIGIPVPVFAVELARERLTPRHLTAATCLAQIYDPETAVDAGYLDRLVPAEQVPGAAVSAAQELTVLRRTGFRLTRRNLRGATLARIREGLENDLSEFRVEPPEDGS